MQPGDVVATYADVDELIADFDFKPSISIDVGVKKFIDWYQQHYENFAVSKNQVIAKELIAVS